MGMSGVGKTYLAKLLPRQEWFHYSVDYRIGTRYLGEEIDNRLKMEAMKNPTLARLLRSNSIAIHAKITFDNLEPLSAYVGMVGDLEKGGLPLEEFIERLEKHRQAEICATRDALLFMERAEQIYGYKHFICDTSGSLCEIDDEETWETLFNNALLIYLEASDTIKDEVIKRAQTHPKPLYYNHRFLLEKIAEFAQKNGLSGWQEIDPNAFAQWVFPHLIEHRVSRYEALANRYGITIPAERLYGISGEKALINLIKEYL